MFYQWSLHIPVPAEKTCAFRRDFLGSLESSLRDAQVPTVRTHGSSVLFRATFLRPFCLWSSHVHLIDRGEVSLDIQEDRVIVSLRIRFKHWFCYCFGIVAILWVAYAVAAVSGADPNLDGMLGLTIGTMMMAAIGMSLALYARWQLRKLIRRAIAEARGQLERHDAPEPGATGGPS